MAEMRPKRQAGSSPGGLVVIVLLPPGCGLSRGDRQSKGELAGSVCGERRKYTLRIENVTCTMELTGNTREPQAVQPHPSTS